MSSQPWTGCLLLNGTPGAGKSTVARLLAARLPRAAVVAGDDVAQMVVSGRASFLAEGAEGEEGQRQLLLRARGICALADTFAEAAFVPVLDHVVPDRSVLELVLATLRVRPLLLVTLAPTLEVASRRNATRDPRERVDYAYDALRATMAHELGSVGWWFDTSELTADETVEAILAEAPSRARVG